jgi:tetratricopeptide (TPR) repeat protein
VTAAGGARRAVFPLLVGGLLGFIGGYFAGGGGKPMAPPAASAAAGTEDRVTEVRKAVEKDSQNPKLLTALGNICYDRNDWDGAIEAYEKARRKASSDPNLLSDLGAAYRNRGDFKKAVACFEKARAADPDHWQSLLNLVLIEAFDMRDAEASRRHFEELKRRFSDMPNLDRIEKQIKSLGSPASTSRS